MKLKLGLQIGERLLVVTNWINQKQGEINKYHLNVVFIKLKLGLEIGGRLLVVTNWINQKQGEINKYDLTVVCFSSFRSPSELCAFCQGHSSRRPMDLTAVPHPRRFLVQGYILSDPGDSVNLKHKTCSCNPMLVVSREL
jgi:hypothetical protein